jgi:diacylglycerol kinase (ATP)
MQHKQDRKNKNIIESFNNAINGILYTIKSERNMKFHIAAAITVLLLSLFFDLTRVEFLILCLAVSAVLICELFNTALEVLVDIVVDGYHPKAKIVKDVAAGAVLVSAFTSLIVGYLIFFDRLGTSLEIGITRLKRSPMHITLIALLITIILVLVMKAYFRKGTPFQGGMPSGHSALAFSAATSIALWTDHVKISILGLIIALLVMQSRYESRIHTMFELAAGAALGFLVTLALFQVFYR